MLLVLVCIRMSLVCCSYILVSYSHVLACYSYVFVCTRMCPYVLVCTRVVFSHDPLADLGQLQLCGYSICRLILFFSSVECQIYLILQTLFNFDIKIETLTRQYKSTVLLKIYSKDLILKARRLCFSNVNHIQLCKKWVKHCILNWINFRYLR